MSLARQHRVVAAILGLFVTLGLAYGIASPIFESSDELYHYIHAKHLADGRGIPVPSTDAKVNPARQEATQPPLYYAIGALATFWIDTGDLADLNPINPHAEKGQPAALDNKNMVIHTSEESFPYSGLTLAVKIIRLLSIGMGALTILLTYLITREVIPGKPTVAIGAALVNALIPQFLFISASVNNDNLVALTASSTLLLLLRLVGQDGDRSPAAAQPRLWQLALLGTLAGLAALSKLGGILLIPLIGVTLVWLAVRRRSPGRLIIWGLATAGPALLVAGWWYVRNLILYGDPALLQKHLSIVGGRSEPITILEILLSEGQGLRWSFWGVFGGFNVVADTLIYHLYDAATVLALLGLGMLGVRHWRRWLGDKHCGRRLPSISTVATGHWHRYPVVSDQADVPSSVPANRQTASPQVRWPAVVILAFWSLLLLVSLLRWSQSTMASQGRLLFPAISALCIALFAGWRALAPRVRPVTLLAVVGTPMLLLAAMMPYYYIGPAYTRPPRLAPGTVEMMVDRGFVDVSYDDQMMLVAYELSDSRVVPGQSIELDLYWRVLAPIDRDYSIYVHVYDQRGQLIAEKNTYPGGGAYATSHLSPGDELHDRYVLPVSPDAQPGQGHIGVGLYEYSTMALLQAYDGAGQPLVSPNIASFEIYRTDWPAIPAEHATSYTFGGAAEVAGYRLDTQDTRPGGVVDGALYLQARKQMDRDYTIFVHIAEPGEPPVAQFDAPPQNSTYPTSLWNPGDKIYHPFSITLPDDVQPGVYALLVGFYEPTTGERLAITMGWPDRISARLGHIARPEMYHRTMAELTTVRINHVGKMRES